LHINGALFYARLVGLALHNKALSAQELGGLHKKEEGLY